ncbi:hypothetical protein GOODEAATRI_002567, partial [Goodea atripinnis]
LVNGLRSVVGKNGNYAATETTAGWSLHKLWVSGHAAAPNHFPPLPPQSRHT